MVFELSSVTGSVSTLSSCASTAIQQAKTYFEQKSIDILSSVTYLCGTTRPAVTMPDVSGYYLCPGGQSWDQGILQCVGPGNYSNGVVELKYKFSSAVVK